VNRQVRKLALVLLGCFTVLFVQLNVIQLVRADEFNDRADNTRAVVRDFSRARGRIVSADGVILAESVPSGDRFDYQRVYPTGDLFGHVTGYFSFQFGTDGVEKQYNDILSGHSAGQQLQGLLNFLDDRPNVGDVTVTLRNDIQAVAKRALGDRQGSVVALDPRTGAILALWSYPSFDPNVLAGHDFDEVRQARAALLDAPNNPLLPKAYRERYLPGSAFKVVTATAGLDTGTVTPETVYPPTSEYLPPGTTDPIENYGGTVCGGDLYEVFRRSCNTAFAEMGVDVGAEGMVRTAEAYGYNRTPPLDLPRPAQSSFPSVSDFRFDTPKLAQVSFGQNDNQVTPLNLALISAAVANHGVMMAPHVLSEARDRDGNVLDRYQPKAWQAATSNPSTLAFLNEAMVQVVNSGTARCCLQLASGAQAAAKTGTAQITRDPPRSHAWITAFAPAEAPRVAVAVIVNTTPEVTAGTGGTIAGPIAKQVLDAVLATPDPLAGGRR
jgi:peptidoglycan glycosyltransferase